MSDEANDQPPVTIDMVYLAGVILLVLLCGFGVFLGSWMLHSFDAEIRQLLTQAINWVRNV